MILKVTALPQFEPGETRRVMKSVFTACNINRAYHHSSGTQSKRIPLFRRSNRVLLRCVVFMVDVKGSRYAGMQQTTSVSSRRLLSPGTIVTARKFDRERQREYAVTVTATDQANDPLIGICQLNILIVDQNDNSPKFENIRYECE